MSNSTQRSPKAVARAFSTTAVLSIAALALAGCGEEDPREAENPQENLDQDGAEDQGVYSDEIAENEDDQEVADLAEIETEVWESSLEQESVDIFMTAGLERGQELFGYAPEFFEGEGESFELSVIGELEGDAATELNYSTDFQVLTFGEDSYQSVEAFVFDYEAQVPPEVEPEVDGEELSGALVAQGDWVDVSDAEPAVPRTPDAVIELLRSEVTETLDVDSLAELELDASLDTRDGENVWVYSNEDVELAVLADEGSPQLMGLILPGADEDLEVTLTDWDEADTPEEPEDETIIDDEQLQGILNDLV